MHTNETNLRIMNICIISIISINLYIRIIKIITFAKQTLYRQNGLKQNTFHLRHERTL